MVESWTQLARLQRVVSLRALNTLRADTNAARHITITAIQIMNGWSNPVTETDSTENEPTKP